MALNDDFQSNRLSDFPPEKYHFVIFCEACGRSAILRRNPDIDLLTIDHLRDRLSCSKCGQRGSSIRIVFTGCDASNSSQTDCG